ncbi:MAG: MBL fold metallo-hydrolase [Marmoricola sp.]
MEPTLQFVGNATTVLRLGPFTLLTDPNFLHRGQLAYLGKGVFSRRLTDPALEVEDLPPLDAVVLSHMHGDHWDRVARRGLDRDLPILTTPASARALGRQGFGQAVGMPTWTTEELSHGDATLTTTALPGRNGTGLGSLLVPPVMGSLIELQQPGAEPFRLYVSGDTLFVDELGEIAERFPRVDAAVLHLGGTTLPGGLLVSMDDVQGAALLELIGAATNVPVHHSDYGRFRSPIEDFREQVRRRGTAERVRWAAPGETVGLGPVVPGSA